MDGRSTLEENFARYRASRSPDHLTPVFQALSPLLLSTARRAGLSAQSAEDVVQDTFLALIEGENRFEHGRPLRPWVLGIARRQISVEKRRRSRLRLLPGGSSDGWPLDEETDATPPSPLASRETRDSIRRAIEALPEGNRRVLTAVLLDGVSLEQSARDLGLSRAAAAQRLHRGLRRLRERLGERSSLGLLALLVPRTGRGLPPTGLLAGRGMLVSAAAAALGSVAALAALRAWPGDDRDSVETGPPQLVELEVVQEETGRPDRHADASGAMRVAAKFAAAPRTDAAAAHNERRGTVTDAVGAPAVGAEVFLLSTTPGLVLPTSALVPSAVVGPDGSYALDAEAFAADTTPLLLVRAGSSVGWVDVESQDAGAALPPVRLGPELVFAAHVTDSAGRPIADAEVVAYTDSRFLAPGGPEADEFGFFPVSTYRHIFGARSDAMGIGVVHGLIGANSSGLFLGCSVGKPGFAREMRAYIYEGGERLDVDFVLYRPEELALQGRITGAEGVPLEGVEVRIPIRGETLGNEDVVALSGADGRWSVQSDLLDDFPLRVSLRCPGHLPHAFLVQHPEELLDGTYDVALQAETSLRGRVLDASGDPVAGASVTVSTARYTEGTTTDEDGAFTVGGLDRAARRVRVGIIDDRGVARERCKDLGTEQDQVVVRLPREDRGPSSLELALTGGSSWTRVTLLPVPGSSTRPASSVELADDRAHFGALAPGVWMACGLTGDGGAVVARVDVDPDPAPLTRTVDPLQLGFVECVVDASAITAEDTWCRLVARNVDVVDLPAWIQESHAPPVWELELEAHADQPLGLGNLIPGTWQITASGDGWCTDVVEIDVSPDHPFRVDLTPARSGIVEVHLPGGAHVDFLRFEVRRDDHGPWKLAGFSSVAKAMDTYVEIDLPPGVWEWRASLLSSLEHGEPILAAPRMFGRATVREAELTVVEVLDGTPASDE